jgi:hypothetical protein
MAAVGRHWIFGLLLAVSGVAFAAERLPPSLALGLAPLAAKQRIEVAPPAAGKLAALAAVPIRKGSAMQYGLVLPHLAKIAAGDGAAGTWQTLADGRALWRAELRSPGAVSLELAFDRFFLPQGAELWLASPDGATVRGPWTDADNPANGRFHTPLVWGDTVLVELVVPAALRAQLDLRVAAVGWAFRNVMGAAGPNALKSGSCNVDTICPQGDGRREQIRSAATYTFSSGGSTFVCTGQLLNNTAQDRRRLLSSANHCLNLQSEADTVVVYWKYESPTCRAVGSIASGTPIPRDGNSIVQIGGATLRATYEPSDFTLLELRTTIPNGVDPYWSGWDRSDSAPTSAFAIHHPQGDEKRISFENGPTSITTVPVQFERGRVLPAGNGLRVLDWDEGTTEQGSSGSGLYNPQRRVVGFLSGGNAACGNELEDYYGRLSVGWAGGGSDASRLSTWLDPAGSGAQVLDGTANCTAPTIALTVPSTVSAGADATFSASATGTGPFTYAWDVDGDGVVDRTQAAAGASSSVTLRYPNARSGVNVGITITDATGCAASTQRALGVTGPRIEATAQAPTQVCGDNDGQFDPGEVWQLPVGLANNGSAALNAGYATFAPSQGGGTAADNFGYRILDNTSGACPYSYIDINASAALALTAASGNFDAADDGRTALQALGPTPFNFYGENVSALVMSTNGYLSTSNTDNGGDFANTCALELPGNGGAGGQLRILHDDLVVQAGGGLRRQYFANCPRAADAGSGPRGCTVFSWTNMGRYNQSGLPEGAAEFQAILYDGTYQIVTQYRAADPLGGGGATLSLQNATATDRAQYACNQNGSAGAARAVCYFHPSALPAQFGPSKLVMAPAALPATVAVGATQGGNLKFQIEGDAACGSRVAVDFLGAVDANAYSRVPRRLYEGSVASTCQVQQSCLNVAFSPPLTVPAEDGLYANPTRFGNGIGSFIIPNGTDATFFGAWFTGEADRDPTWLILQGPYTATPFGEQGVATIYRFRLSGTAPFAVSSAIVGSAVVAPAGRRRIVVSWTVDGESGAEVMDKLYPDSAGTPNRTGVWFSAGEPGWGEVLDDHVVNGANESVIINYLYGTDNVARWTVGASADLNQGPMTLNAYRVHCPTCPSFVDFGSFPLPAGTLQRSFSSQTRGTYSTNSVIANPPLNWVRSNLPIEMISAPR